MNAHPNFQIINSKTRYLFGFEAYSREKKREYIFNTSADYSNCLSIDEITVVRYFKIPFYKIIRKHDVITHLLFGFKIKKETAAEIYYKHKLKQINIKYDDAYLLISGSGEAFKWLAYAARIHFDRNNSKKPLAIVNRESFVDLVHMYLPDVPCYVSKRIGGLDSENPYIEYAGHRVFIDCHHLKIASYLAFNPLYLEDLQGICRQFALSGVQKDNMNYAKPIKSEPIVPNESKESLMQKISEIKLNIDNFVFLAPEANTFLMAPVEFWKQVVNKFINKGVDVFLNSINENHYIPGCKSLYAPLSYSESFELVSKSKAVISLRSGFSETVLPTEVPEIIVMTIGVGMYGLPNKQTIRNENPLFPAYYVKEEDVRGVWYFDYDTSEQAADRIIYLYDEMTKRRVDAKEETR